MRFLAIGRQATLGRDGRKAAFFDMTSVKNAIVGSKLLNLPVERNSISAI
jgi:hypothetical protein